MKRPTIFDEPELFDLLAQPSGDGHGVVDGGIGEDDDKFVAAEADELVLGAGRRLQDGRERREQTVACLVTEGVIDDFEVV